jgi:ABC-type bacteriocin/lantibiotic exporter with double-glycine peptidase domain
VTVSGLGRGRTAPDYIGVVVALLKYSVLRLALFVATLALLALLHAGLLLASLLAVLISMMLSYVLLRGPRDALAQQISDRAHHRIVAAQQRVGAKAAQDEALEDAADDARRQADAGGDPNR